LEQSKRRKEESKEICNQAAGNTEEQNEKESKNASNCCQAISSPSGSYYFDKRCYFKFILTLNVGSLLPNTSNPYCT
jgi:hypothetical protein